MNVSPITLLFKVIPSYMFRLYLVILRPILTFVTRYCAHFGIPSCLYSLIGRTSRNGFYLTYVLRCQLRCWCSPCGQNCSSAWIFFVLGLNHCVMCRYVAVLFPVLQSLCGVWTAVCSVLSFRVTCFGEFQCQIWSALWSHTLTLQAFNPLTPNDRYSGRTTPLTSKRCILYIYSTNTGTEYFKHGIYSPFFSLQNAVCFIILTYVVPVLFTFCIQGVLKLKKKMFPAPKG